MLFWMVLVAMTGAAVLFLVAPLIRARSADSRRLDYDLAVYRDQLAELDRDVARGVVPRDDATSARLEIERRILAAARDDGRDDGREDGSSTPARAVEPRRRWALAAGLGTTVSAAALALYLMVGAPGLPDQPLALRTTERALLSADGTLDLTKVAAELGKRLQERPDSVEGWLLLARTQASLERWPESAASFRRAIDLLWRNADGGGRRRRDAGGPRAVHTGPGAGAGQYPHPVSPGLGEGADGRFHRSGA
jgi:cytochrome c-type biogenesis protein CcmH